MSWILKNGKCRDPFQRVSFVKCGAYNQVKVAIDEFGRLYTTGGGAYSTIGFPNPGYLGGGYYEYPKWIGILRFTIPPGLHKRTFVDFDSNEYQTVIQEPGGQLWQCGWNYTPMLGISDEEAWEIYNAPQNFLSTETSSTPGYVDLWTFRRMPPEFNFKKFRLGWYSGIAIGHDGFLYTWGVNHEGELGLGWDYSYKLDLSDLGFGYWDHALHDNTAPLPIKNHYVTEPVKLVDADCYVAACVTESDRVYVTGNLAWEIFDDIVTLPDGTQSDTIFQEVSISLPEGETIVDLGCALSILYVITSSGDLYVAGGDATAFGLSYATGDELGTLRKVTVFTYPGVDSEGGRIVEQVPAPKLVKAKVGDWSAFIGIDDEGYMWCTGWASYINAIGGPWEGQFPVYDDALDPNDEAYAFVSYGGSREFKGRRFKDAMYCEFHGSGAAVDEIGYVDVWGMNWGERLGLGLPDELMRHLVEMQHSYPSANQLTETTQVGYYAFTYDFDYPEEFLTGANYNKAGVSPFDQPPDQLEEHNLCGHWHLNVLGEEEETWVNCWYVTLAVNNEGKIRLHFSGRWWPWQFGLYEYDISANTWKLLYMRDDHWGAGYHDGEFYWGHGMMIFFNGSGIGTGNAPYDYKIDSVGQGVWVWEESEMVDGVFPDNYHPLHIQFADIARTDGKHRMGVDSEGTIFIVGSLGSSLVVRKSVDRGVTWQDIQSIAIDDTVLDWKLAVDPSKIGNYQVAVLKDSGFNLYGDTDGGASPHSYGYRSVGETGALRIEFICAAPMGSTTERWLLSVAFVDRTVVLNGTYVGDTVWDTLMTHEGFTVNLEYTIIDNSVKPVLFDNGYAYVSKYTGNLQEAALGIPTSDLHFGVASNQISTLAAAGFAITVPDNPEVAMVFSEDNGETWHIRATPLNHSDNWDDPEHDIMFAIKGVNWKQVEEWKYPYPKIPPLKIQYGPFPEEPN